MNHLSKLVCIILLCLGQMAVAQNLEDFKKIEVSRYVCKPSKEFKLLTVPASFANSQLFNKSIMDSLTDKKIASIRLVYTKYRESETFNQNELNKKRIENLVAINPKLFSNAGIRWYSVEQTLEDSVQAKSLFHGFYILYQNQTAPREYAISDKLLNKEVLVSQIFKFKNNKDTTLVGKEGSQIHIQSNCFLDENKKPFKGEVKMEVKEAITMESIILGNLVTMADGNALESGGMIYIDAKTKDGKSLTLNPAKPMEVSMAAKEVKPDMKIWEGEQNGKFMNWKNPKPINNGFNKSELPDKKPSALRENENNIFDAVRCFCTNNRGYSFYYELIGNNRIKVELYSIKMSTDYFETLIADTSYDALNLNNKNIPLPKPTIEGEDCFTPVFYKNKQLDWFGKFPTEAIRNMDYKFNFSKIGSWANIDRLAGDQRTKLVEFSASLPDKQSFDEVSMYLIFKDKKMYIPGFKSTKNKGYGFSHGDFEKPKLPIGAKATVLCIAYKNDKPFFAMQNITITEKQEILMNPTASSDEAIKKLIADSF